MADCPPLDAPMTASHTRNSHDSHYSRREALALLGLGASGLLILPMSQPGAAQTRAATCVVRPTQSEGPYFVDERLNRSDVRSDPTTGIVKPGAALRLAFQVSKIESGACTPLSNAQVDIWQCDALGVYSDVRDSAADTRGQKFLRGHQFTDAQGHATFLTIYPGWYRGRTVHIHFKIRSAAGRRAAEFTSQLYFDDTLSDTVLLTQPYASRGRRDVRNAQDGLYARGGRELMLVVNRGAGAYEASFDIGLNIS